MNRNSSAGICLIHAKTADFAIYANVIMSELWTIGFCNYWEQFKRKSYNLCDINYGLTSIGRILFAFKYNKWPDSTFEDMKEAWDFPTIYNLTRQNYSISRYIKIENFTYTYPETLEGNYGTQSPPNFVL